MNKHHQSIRTKLLSLLCTLILTAITQCTSAKEYTYDEIPRTGLQINAQICIVRAFGPAPQQVSSKVQRRNQSRQYALLEAQTLIRKIMGLDKQNNYLPATEYSEYDPLPAINGKPPFRGRVISEKFDEHDNCFLVYEAIMAGPQ